MHYYLSRSGVARLGCSKGLAASAAGELTRPNAVSKRSLGTPYVRAAYYSAKKISLQRLGMVCTTTTLQPAQLLPGRVAGAEPKKQQQSFHCSSTKQQINHRNAEAQHHQPAAAASAAAGQLCQLSHAQQSPGSSSPITGLRTSQLRTSKGALPAVNYVAQQLATCSSRRWHSTSSSKQLGSIQFHL